MDDKSVLLDAGDHSWEIEFVVIKKTSIDGCRAVCTCGWRSRSYRQNAMAHVAGVNHVETIAYIAQTRAEPRG